MATKEQYDFFRDQYNDEEKRYSDLTKRGEIYFSILSIIFTGIVFKLKDIWDIFDKTDKNAIIIPFILLLAILVLFGIGFFLLLRSFRIREYQSVMDYEVFRNSLGESPPENTDFFDDRIVDYMFAIEINEAVNDKRADDLYLSLRFIAWGFAFVIIFILIILSQKI